MFRKIDSYDTINEQKNQEYDFHPAGIPVLTALYAPQVFAADALYTYLSDVLSRRNFIRLGYRIAGKDPQHYELRERIEKILETELPISSSDAPQLYAEVQKYKWLEAERAGRDIWREKSPKDPDAIAVKEWFRQYFGAWYLAHKQAQRAS